MTQATRGWRPAGRVDGLTAPLATVAFAGIFNTGKSSVINRLIGRGGLPTGPLPETGCPVRLVHPVAAPFAPRLDVLDDATLRDLTSLHDAFGMRRGADIAGQGLTLALDRPGFAPGTALVDLPGINDEGAISQQSFRAAVAADAVVLVLNSRQFLSLAEQDFLARLIAARGADGLAIAVNLFLPEGVPFARWAERALSSFQERQEAVLRDAGLDPSAIPVFEVNAHPDGDDPFGGLSRLKTWIAQFSGPDAPVTRFSRQQRAAVWRKRIADRIAPARDRAAADLARAEAQEKRHRKDKRQMATFVSKDLPEIWSAAQDRLMSVLEAEATRFAEAIAKDGLCRDDRYEKQLFLAVSDTMMGAHLDGEIRLALAARDLPAPDDGLLTALRRAVTFTPEAVVVADTPLAVGRIAIWGVIGGVFTLGAGALAAGAALAYAKAEKRNADIQETARSFDSAAQGYLNQFHALGNRITGVIAPHLYVSDAPSDLAQRRARLVSLDRRAICV